MPKLTIVEIEHRTRENIIAIRAGLLPHQERRLEQEILDMYEPLIFSVALRFIRTYVYHNSDVHDLSQAARIGVIKAIRAFDLERANGFGTFVFLRIRKEIQQLTLVDRMVRLPQGDRNRKDYFAPPIIYDLSIVQDGTGDHRDDVEDAERSREIARYDLEHANKITTRRIRRRLRQQGHIE